LVAQTTKFLKQIVLQDVMSEVVDVHETVKELVFGLKEQYQDYSEKFLERVPQATDGQKKALIAFERYANKIVDPLIIEALPAFEADGDTEKLKKRIHHSLEWINKGYMVLKGCDRQGGEYFLHVKSNLENLFSGFKIEKKIQMQYKINV
jgi:hypothetical protein